MKVRDSLLVIVVISFTVTLQAQNWESLGPYISYPSTETTSSSIEMVLDASGTPYVASLDNITNKGIIKKFDGNGWVEVGNPKFSDGWNSNYSMAFNESGILYVAYSDYSIGQKLCVEKWDGNEWVYMGNPGFSAGATIHNSLAFDASGVPYVAYSDIENGGKGTVQKWNGSSWEYVGISEFSEQRAWYISLVFDIFGQPFVAFEDEANGWKASVKRLNAGTWETVGSAGLSAGTASFISLVIDDLGTPYVSYLDVANSSKASVQKFNGTTWEYVGNPGFSDVRVMYTSLAFDNSGVLCVTYTGYVKKWNGSTWEDYQFGTKYSNNPYNYINYNSLAFDPFGTLYVVFQDESDSFRAVVKKLKYGTNLGYVEVGSEGLSEGYTSSVTLKLNSLGTPFVAYHDELNWDRASVQKWNGNNWEYVGMPGFSARVMDLSMALDPNGDPYVVYGDYENSRKATVQRWNGSAWEYVGNRGFSANPSVLYSLAIDAEGTAYVAYRDLADSKKISVQKWNGDTWEYLGMPEFTIAHCVSLALDNSGVPYVAAGGRVFKWNGTNWESIGGLDDGIAYYNSLALDSDGFPYVAFSDYSNDTNPLLCVGKWNGNTWEYVGSRGFVNASGVISLALDAAGSPVIAYSDKAHDNKTSVQKFNGTTWEYVGTPGFTYFNASSKSLGIDYSSGDFYIAYIHSPYKTNYVYAKKYRFCASPIPDIASLPDIIEVCEASPSPPTATNNCGIRYYGTADVSFPITTVGTTEITWIYDDGQGNTASQSQNVTITNQSPEILNFSVSQSPNAVSFPVLITAEFTDENLASATWDWGDPYVLDPSSSGIIDNSSNTISGSYKYSNPGVYTVKLTIKDNCGETNSEIFQYIVIYDPTEGFVSGAGWIDSPAGSFKADLSLEGNARFGFVSKYQKGSTVPIGNSDFKFKAGDLHFNSDEYEWLVIAGSKAMFKGTGAVNGIDGYGFLLSVVDADLTQSADIDRFRIKIWELVNEDLVIYDNNLNETEIDAAPTTDIAGGVIIIHTKDKIKNASIIDPEAKITIYPNPFDNSIHLDLYSETSHNINIDMIDMNGRVIEYLFTGVIASGIDHHFEFNTRADLNPGSYLLRIRTEQGEVISREIIIKE